MSDPAASIIRRESRIALRLEVACEFSAVRAATLAVRAWLGERGLPATELAAWELALVEAANNAVEHASGAARAQPMVIEVSRGEREVEVRITDHTEGFDWPRKVNLPEMDAESGRGLFLIQSLTDQVVYLRHTDGNVLVLRRAVPVGASEQVPDVCQLQKRLAEAESALTEMTAELASSYESLVALFRYGSELGAHTDPTDFSQRLLKDLVQIAEADCAVLRLVAHDGSKLEAPLVLIGGGKSQLPPVALAAGLVSVEAGAARTRQDIWFNPEEPLAERDPLRAVMPAGNGLCHAFFVAGQLVGTATLGRLLPNKPFTAAQVNLLHTFIDFLAIQIVNARLLDERSAARVTRRELQIAADIQRSLLPARIPACLPFEVLAACRSALQVGGDFYDVIPAGNGALLLVIADVMGKGVPAALFAAVMRTTLRSMPQFFDRPGELLAAANRTLYPDLSAVDMFITAKLAYLDPRRQVIVTASAGHCPLLVCQPKLPAAVVTGHSGLPLGIESATRYEQVETSLPPGTLAMLYTDGLTEARNAAGEMLGEELLLQMLAQTVAQTTNTLSGKQFLLARLAEFTGQAPLNDDQTLILIRHPV